MKAMGIVRRIDGLGRIVIPKEARNVLNIKDGDNLEMFFSEDGVFMRPYQKVSEETKLLERALEHVNNDPTLEREIRDQLNEFIQS